MDEPNSEPLGAILEKRRHALRKSLIDAEEVTKIRAKHLEALEHGEYDTLPSPAYVKGYIVSYAKYLGLDSGPLLEAYEKEAGLEEPETPHLPDQVVAPRSQAHSIPVRTALAVVAVVALLAVAVWGVGRLVSEPEAPPPIPVAPESAPPAESEVPPEAGPGVPDEESLPDEEPADVPEEGDVGRPEGPFSVRVVIAEDSASWMRVTIDGLTAYEGTMAGGQTEEWTAEESAVLRIGRAPAVTVYQDGIPVEIPGGDPPVLELPVDPS